MEHMDEKILELINDYEEMEEQKNYKQHLRKGVLEGRAEIIDQVIEFEEKILLNDKISIRIPKTFEIMKPEIASLKYPSERRPSLIYTNETTSINVSFNLTNSDVDNSDIENFKNGMQEVLKKVQPSAQWLESGVDEINGKNIGYFDFVTPALDTKIYNFIFCAELYGKALMININCTEAEMEDWKHMARGVMDSFKVCPPQTTRKDNVHRIILREED